MSFLTMYTLCTLITICYVTIDNADKHPQHRGTERIIAILILGVFWPVLITTTLVGFLFSFLKELFRGNK